MKMFRAAGFLVQQQGRAPSWDIIRGLEGGVPSRHLLFCSSKEGNVKW